MGIQGLDMWGSVGTEYVGYPGRLCGDRIHIGLDI